MTADTCPAPTFLTPDQAAADHVLSAEWSCLDGSVFQLEDRSLRDAAPTTVYSDPTGAFVWALAQGTDAVYLQVPRGNPSFQIMRVPRDCDGGACATKIADLAWIPCGLAMDGDAVLFCAFEYSQSSNPSVVWLIEVPGLGGPLSVRTHLDGVASLGVTALDARGAVLVDGNTVEWLPVDDTGPRVLARADAQPVAVAMNDRAIYWRDVLGRVWRVARP